MVAKTSWEGGGAIVMLVHLEECMGLLGVFEGSKEKVPFYGQSRKAFAWCRIVGAKEVR